MEKFKARNFCLVLYEEDETHLKAIEKIKNSYDYAMICHDRDINSEGEIKKAHYHVVLRFNNPKWSSALASELGITENYLEEARSLKRALLYLIHFYDEDKFQYSVDDVQGSLKTRLVEFLRNDGKSENEKVLEIFKLIDDTHGFIDFRIFVKQVAIMGYYDVLRRSTGIIMKYIECHNSDVKYLD